ncbi:MAG TPA: hypothetical protein DCM60_07290 [Nitrospina sp.]|nr:hypothetical protein [Nitrospina sp.]
MRRLCAFLTLRLPWKPIVFKEVSIFHGIFFYAEESNYKQGGINSISGLLLVRQYFVSWKLQEV